VNDLKKKRKKGVQLSLGDDWLVLEDECQDFECYL